MAVLFLQNKVLCQLRTKALHQNNRFKMQCGDLVFIDGYRDFGKQKTILKSL